MSMVHPAPGLVAGLDGIMRRDAVANVRRAWEAGRLDWSRFRALAVLQGWRLVSKRGAA